MRLHIPNLGEEIMLKSDWTFTLINESRNSSLFGDPVIRVGTEPYERQITWYNHPAKLEEEDTAWQINVRREFLRTEPFTAIVGEGLKYIYNETGERVKYEKLPDKEVTLPAGTILVYDRIYIRKGQDKFDSVTFKISWCPNESLNKKRFFARLNDVNNIEIQLQGDNND